MAINLKRLKELFTEINSVNDTSFGGGISRLAYTDDDKRAREIFINHCKDAGLKVEIDEIGNIFARRDGLDNSLKAVAFGSHLDTVINGGEYDGILGVLGGLEVIRSLNDENIKTKHPLELVVFACEESSRFNISTLGSKTMCGKLDTQKLKSVKDFKNSDINEIFSKFGLNLENIKNIKNRALEYKNFIELHIEQGPLLYNENIQIGVVSAIAAPHRFSIKIKGEAQHSGTTAMKYRTDALCAAAKIILAVESVAKRYANEGVVATCGNCIVSPGVMNVVPGEAKLLVDLRGINLKTRDNAYNDILSEINLIQKECGFEYEIEKLAFDEPVALDSDMIDLIKQEALNLKYSCEIMPSGAGHDAMHVCEFCKTGMIFIPSKDGISHNPAEFSSDEDMERGVNLLKNVVLKLAN